MCQEDAQVQSQHLRKSNQRNFLLFSEGDMILRRSLFLLLLSFNFLHALPEGKWKMTVMLTKSNDNVII